MNSYIELPQGARKSGAKTALLRALLALTVSIDLSALDGERDEMRVGEGGEGQQGEIRVGPEAVPRGGISRAVRRLYRFLEASKT